jgi:N-methylhydantoinase B
MSEQGKLPASLDDIQGELYYTHPKQFGIVIGPDEVFEWSIMAGAGYGDPLERDPEQAAQDVATGRYDPELAEELFAVTVDSTGKLDASATDTLRSERRKQRLSRAVLPKAGQTGEVNDARRPFLEAIDVAESSSGDVFVCNRCDHPMGSTSMPYKHWCAIWEGELAQIAPGFRDPAQFVDDHMVWREFYCPSCGVMIENEIAREGEELLDDAHLAE